MDGDYFLGRSSTYGEVDLPSSTLAAGAAVSCIGDYNGDGYADFAVGDTGSAGGAGEVNVVFGSETFDFGLSPTFDGKDGFKFHGLEPNDLIGLSVSGGDINGDGYDDLVAAGYDAVYVVFGEPGRAHIDIYADMLDGSDGFAIDASGIFGGLTSVDVAGDFNGDGYDDIIIGAELAGADNTGEAFLVFGRPSGFASINLGTLDGSDGFVVRGAESLDRFGFSVSGAGDLNGDNFDDVVVGANQADPNGLNSAGISYILFGALGTSPDLLS